MRENETLVLIATVLIRHDMKHQKISKKVSLKTKIKKKLLEI